MTFLLADVPFWARGILLGLFFLASAVLILTILIQKPMGGGLAGAFGSGAGSGQTAFGARTGDALTIATIIMFVVFVLGAIGLNYAVRPSPPPITPPAIVNPGTPAPIDEGTPTETSETIPGENTPTGEPQDPANPANSNPPSDNPPPANPTGSEPTGVQPGEPTGTPPGEPTGTPNTPANEPTGGQPEKPAEPPTTGRGGR